MACKAKTFVDAIEAWSIRVGPMHERLSAAIQDGVRLGSLRPGMRLPAERHLASLLDVSRTTIVSAYNELRRDGWIESRVGSGTWINREKACSVRGATRMASLAKSPILHASKQLQPGSIDFASAMTTPLPEAVRSSLFPSEAHVKRMFCDYGQLPFGLPELRNAVARYYSALGVATTEDQILITNGGQQAVSLICSLFLHPGTPVLAENPTYYGSLEALRMTGARLYPIPVGNSHISPTALRERLLKLRPKLFYVTPSGQNPTGTVMSEVDRSTIAKDSAELGTILVEDETMADLVFSRRRLRPLAAFDTTGNILTVGSLSRVVWPNLRIGWIRASRANIARLVKVKTSVDLSSPTVTQSLAVEFLRSFGDYRQIRHNELLAKRDLLTQLLVEHLPSCDFNIPDAGLSIWLRMPGVDTRILAQCALRQGLVLSTGNVYSVDDSHSDFLRIPFVLEPAVLDDGVRRLRAVYERVGRRLISDSAYSTPLGAKTVELPFASGSAL